MQKSDSSTFMNEIVQPPAMTARKKTIRIVTDPILKFIRMEQFSGILLIIATATALIWANTPGGELFTEFWEKKISITAEKVNLSLSLHHWINDGLMALFFLLVGLEIKREVLYGDLSSPQKAMFPIFAALGGMLAPALIYVAFNFNEPTLHGWGIPTATDIAFSLAVISLAGKRVPVFLKIFMTALAIADDLGAVVIIGIFYTGNLEAEWLLAALGIFASLLVLNKLGLRSLAVYLTAGIFLWYCMFMSGVHATLAGVLLAFTIPAGQRFTAGELIDFLRKKFIKFFESKENEADEITETIDEVSHQVVSPLQKLEDALYTPVSYVILPIFALANTGIVLNTELLGNFFNPVSFGILVGLFIGKPLGITILSWISVKLKLAHLPRGINWKKIMAVSVTGGIGFTMSIFVTMLAFKSPELQADAKLSILCASFASGFAGWLLLKTQSKT